jgi:hypothetical protein
METPQMPGVLISPYAGLAKVLQGVYGGYQEAEADKEYRALAEEARTNQAEDFAKVIGALKTPGQEAIVGQDAVDFVPGSYTPERTSLRNYAETTIPAEFTPTIPGRPAIAAQPAREAGYIGPDLIASLKDPSMRQFAMAQAMAKLEPKAPISVAAGGTLLDPRTFKPVFTAPAAAQRGVAVGQGQELRDPITGALLATGPAKDAKATEPKWEKGQKTVDGKTVYGWYDLSAPNYEASFKAGAVPPAGDTKLIEVTRGGKVYYENPAIVDAAARQAAAIEKEAAPSKKVRMEVTAEDGSTKILLLDETDPRFAEGFATKGPDYVSITTVNAQGMPEIRQVKKDDPILRTGYVKPLEGFLGQLQAAGVPMDTIRSDSKIRDLVDRYFVKTAGGVAPEDVFGAELRKAEVVARLGELGIAVPANIKGLSLSVTPGVLGGAQSANAAAPAPAIAKAPPKINDVVVNGNKKFKFKGGDPNQQSNWVEVK